MIVEGLLLGIFGLIEFLLSPIDIINFVFDTSALSVLKPYFDMVGYLLPLDALMPIIIFFIFLMTFRIAVSIIKTIWSLLPIV